MTMLETRPVGNVRACGQAVTIPLACSGHTNADAMLRETAKNAVEICMCPWGPAPNWSPAVRGPLMQKQVQRRHT